MRWYRTDVPLWGLLTLALTGVYLCADSLIADPERGRADRFANGVGNGFPHFREAPLRYPDLILSPLILAGAVGWVIQAVLIRCGLGVSHRSDPARADYDDASPAPPSAG
jgi:hypothetical protein